MIWNKKDERRVRTLLINLPRKSPTPSENILTAIMYWKKAKSILGFEPCLSRQNAIALPLVPTPPPPLCFALFLTHRTCPRWSLEPAQQPFSRAVMFVARLLVLIKRAEWRNWTVPKMFSETAKRTPDKVMFYFEDQVWTFKQVRDFVPPEVEP